MPVIAQLFPELSTIFDNSLSDCQAVRVHRSPLYNSVSHPLHSRHSELFKASKVPSLDVHETETEFVIQADVPGLSKENLHVEIDDNVLTLSGEYSKLHESETAEEEVAQGDNAEESNVNKASSKKPTYHIKERVSGSFKRSISFPVNVNSSEVKAELDGGVLTLNIPKELASKKVKINIA